MFEARRYEQKDRALWDSFVLESNTNSFLFLRDYMDYHADRFKDYSLLVFKKEKLFAMLPANINEHDKELISHGGLTYGGWLCSADISQIDMFHCFNAALSFLKQNTQVETLIYKQLPNIYQKTKAQQDSYALFHMNGTLIRRDASTVINLNKPYKYTTQTKRNIKKAAKNGLRITENNNNLDNFYAVLTQALSHHNAIPVHSLNELELLKKRFPESIRVFECYDQNNEPISGILTFICDQTIHTQYLASSDKGKELGALAFLLDYLIKDKFCNMDYFSFGTSQDKGKYQFNEGLMRQKEGFGGISHVQDFYALKVQ